MWPTHNTTSHVRVRSFRPHQRPPPFIRLEVLASLPPGDRRRPNEVFHVSETVVGASEPPKIPSVSSQICFGFRTGSQQAALGTLEPRTLGRGPELVDQSTLGFPYGTSLQVGVGVSFEIDISRRFEAISATLSEENWGLRCTREMSRGLNLASIFQRPSNPSIKFRLRAPRSR